MSGLLGSAIAGGVRQVTQGRLNDIDRQEQFNMQNALLQAREDMELRIRESGVQIQEQAAGRERERIKAFSTGENGQSVPLQEAATNAYKAGDIDTAKGLISMTPKSDGKVFDSIKLDDGSVMSFDKSTGKGTIIEVGGKKIDVPKTEIDLALKAAGGDAKKAMELLIQQKSKVAAAGRAPRQPTQFETSRADFIDANRDNPEMVKNGKLTNQGLQEFNRLGKDDGEYDETTNVQSTDQGDVTTKQRRKARTQVFENDPLGLRK